MSCSGGYRGEPLARAYRAGFRNPAAGRCWLWKYSFIKAVIPAQIGAAWLVPPPSNHPSVNLIVAPVPGSASAETSGTCRFSEVFTPGPACHEGRGTYRLTPPPEPSVSPAVSHTSSRYQEPSLFTLTRVPPTAVTPGAVAGDEAPTYLLVGGAPQLSVRQVK